MTTSSNKLLEHFKRMQSLCSVYIEPGDYVSHNGKRYPEPLSMPAFLADIITLLDGPEQREAEASVGNTYIEDALRTESDRNPLAVHELSVGRDERRNARLLHAAMGLSTEAGEFLDALKKHLFYGKPLDLVNLVEEASDIFWYLAIACDALGTTFEEVQALNIAKLRARYPEKFDSDKAINRDLVAERAILEN